MPVVDPMEEMRHENLSGSAATSTSDVSDGIPDIA